MLKNLLTLLIMINISNQKCLDNDVYTNHGLTPLTEAQAISDPSVCQKILKAAGVKACVDLDQYKTFMEGFIKNKNKLADLENEEEAILIEKAQNDLKELETASLETSVLEPEVEAKIEEAKEFVGEEDMKKNFEDQNRDCKKNRNVLDIGVFCLLISDRASEFIVEETFYDGVAGNSGTVTVGETVYDRTFSEKMTVKVLENSADENFKACGKKAKSNCMRKMLDEINYKKNGGADEFEEDKGCGAIKCFSAGEASDGKEGTEEECTDLEKSVMFQEKAGKVRKEDKEFSKKLSEKGEEIKKLVDEKFGSRFEEIKTMLDEKKALEEKKDAGDATVQADLDALALKIKEAKKSLHDEVKALHKEQFANSDVDKKLDEKKKREKKEKPAQDNSEAGQIKEKFEKKRKVENEEIKMLHEEAMKQIKAIEESLEFTEEEKTTKIDQIKKETKEKIDLLKEKFKSEKDLQEKEFDDAQDKNDEVREKREKKREEAPEGEKPAKEGLAALTTDTDSSVDFVNYLVDNSGFDIYSEGLAANIETSFSLIQKISCLVMFISIL